MTLLYHDRSSSRKRVYPVGLNAAHMGESLPRPKTRKLQGRRRRRTARLIEISALDCCGTTGFVA